MSRENQEGAMINIFYRLGDGSLECSQQITEFASLERGKVLWIDLLSPSGEEKKAVESFLNTAIQSRAQAEEIESSSRFFESNGAIHANTNYISPEGDDLSEDPVSFTVCGGTLVTVREIPLRSFTLLQRRILARPEQFPDGFMVFVTMMDQRVDLDADLIELMSKDTAQFSKRINQQEDVNEEFLLDINQLQENTMSVRESVVDKQRIVSNLIKSGHYPPEMEPRLQVLLQDIASLINHTNFTFERLEYLQDTASGLINLEQNRIMKIFTFISLLLMPATLLASFYGMNVSLPFGDRSWTWIAIAALMLCLGLGFWFIFRRKKML